VNVHRIWSISGRDVIIIQFVMSLKLQGPRHKKDGLTIIVAAMG
jgi:hypothetical protein